MLGVPMLSVYTCVWVSEYGALARWGKRVTSAAVGPTHLVLGVQLSPSQ